MDFTPRPDCGACGGTGTIAIDPDHPKEERRGLGSNEGPCVACYFGTHDFCSTHGLHKPCALCAVAAAALSDGTAQPMLLVAPGGAW